MGTYLVNGIIKDITIPKRHISYKEITIDHILASLGDAINLEYYTFKEDDNKYYWEIQPKVLENNLADFLVAQFKMYAAKNNEHMKAAILKIREATSGQDIIDLACSKKLIQFQLVDNLIEYLPVNVGFNNSVMIYFSMMTYFIDGKIIMECYGKILRYFEHVIRLQRNQYPIVDCVKVMITS